MSVRAPREQEIGDFLDKLAEQGQRDSSGVFTLDAARALEKMSRFQLADPHHYGVHLGVPCLPWSSAAPPSLVLPSGCFRRSETSSAASGSLSLRAER